MTGGTITKEGEGYAVYSAGGTLENTGGTINGETYFEE